MVFNYLLVGAKKLFANLVEVVNMSIHSYLAVA